MMTGFVQAAVTVQGWRGRSAPSCDSSQCRSIEVEVRARKNVLWQHKTVLADAIRQAPVSTELCVICSIIT